MDTCVAIEIASIERENIFDAVNGHDGHQAGVVDLGAENLIIRYNALPSVTNFEGVGQQRQGVFNATDFFKHLLWSQPEPIQSYRACRHVPELHDVLRAKEKLMMLFKEPSYRFRTLEEKWMAGLDAP